MGPKIVPCGTRALMVVNLDFTLPIFTRCLRWHKKDDSHLVITFGIIQQLVNKIWWSTLSNALLKSTSSTRIMVQLESSTVFHLCTSSISACTVDVPLIDPNCWGSTWSPAMAVIQALSSTQGLSFKHRLLWRSGRCTSSNVLIVELKKFNWSSQVCGFSAPSKRA